MPPSRVITPRIRNMHDSERSTTMKKFGRILLFLPFATGLCVAVMAFRGHDEAPPRQAREAGAVSPTSGMVAAIDPETGTLTQPTPEQMRELLPQAPASTEKPHMQTFELEDGTVGLIVDETFDHYATVSIGPDGKLHTDCQQGDTHLPGTNGGVAAGLPEQ